MEIKKETVSMYYYYNTAKQKVWTCNASLAIARSEVYNSECYEQVFEVVRSQNLN